MAQKTTLKFFLSFLIASLFVVCYGFGQSIFSNTITGTNPSADNPYTYEQNTDTNIIVSGIGRSQGLTAPGPAASPENRYAGRSWSINLSIDTNDYFEFTLTPNTGYEIDFVSFQYTGQASPEGPTMFAFKSSIDGFTNNIGTPMVGGAIINLSTFEYQNIATSVTFRYYGWAAGAGTGNFSINDFTFNGVVSALPPCSGTPTTFNAGIWDNGEPDLSTPAIIASDYDTTTYGSFSCCSLTINGDVTLTINDEDNTSPTNDYVVVQNDVILNGNITMDPKAAFVQLDDLGTTTGNGFAKVNKETAPMNAWYEYTYWSSPVSPFEIGKLTDTKRRYIFNAPNFLDAKKETENNNTLVDGQDDIDDDGNDWEKVNENTIMEPGVGYAATLTEFAFNSHPDTSNKQFKMAFEGHFNNGIVEVPLYRNDSEEKDTNWNLIGNPYPSAIDADLFLNANQSVDGAIYFWSQNTAPSSTANGNEQLNFSDADYAYINGTGQIAGGDGIIPERKIPSGQAFFVSYFDGATPISTVGDISKGVAVFNNSMRVIGASDNAQFFKNSTSKKHSVSEPNKLWLNLKSDNGVFNQTLIGYVKGASNSDDGSYFDTQKNIANGHYAILYSTIDNSNKKFAIQGKAENSIQNDEIIHLGFKTTIKVATLYSLSIAQLKGDFLTTNTIYLKDNLLNKIHNLSEGDYTFTSEIGEFNERFVILFNNQTLITDNVLANDANTLKIIDLNNNTMKFITSNNLKIKSVAVFDLLGRQLYQFKGQNSEETYDLPDLKHTLFIAKITLSNGSIIRKKAFKK